MWIRNFPKFYLQKKVLDKDAEDLFPVYGNIYFLREKWLQAI